MFKKLPIIIVIFLVQMTPLYSTVIDKVIVRVNADSITLSELDELYQGYKEKSKGLSRELLLKELVKTQILFQLAVKYNIDVTEQVVDEHVQKVKKANKDKKLANLSFIRFNIKRSLTYQGLIRYVIMNRLIKIPDEPELKKEYDKNKEKFQKSEQVKISHILLRTPPGISYDELTTKEKLAESIVKLVKSGKYDFKSLAKKYSEEKQSRDRGGLIEGWWDKTVLSEIIKQYVEIAFTLKKGEISNVFTTSEGYHIIMLMDKKPARTVPFSEMKNYIMNDMLKTRGAKQLDVLLNREMKRSDIEYLSE